MDNQTSRRPLGGRLLPIAAILCVLSLAGMVLALAGRPGAPAFVPPPFDPAAGTGVPDVPEGLGWDEVDAQVFKVSVTGAFAPHDGAADVWLYDPETNECWMKLRVLDEAGNILGETGLVKPGQYVRSVALDPLPPVDSQVTLKVMTYEPETYHSAGSIDLNMTVLPW